MVARARLVAGNPRGQRPGRLGPVDDGERDQREADGDGKPDEKTAPLHEAEAYGLRSPDAETLESNATDEASLAMPLKGRGGFAVATANPGPAVASVGAIRNGGSKAAVSFAESISLSSTGSADLRLPPTAFGSGFDLLALRARRRWESRRGQVLSQEVRKTKSAQFARFQLSTFPQQTLQLVEISSRPSFRVLHMPHIPRPPSIDHGVISFLWAVGLGAYIYFGSLAVGVSSGTAFVFAALGAFAIFLFVRVFGEETPPRRQAIARRRRPSTPRE